MIYAAAVALNLILAGLHLLPYLRNKALGLRPLRVLWLLLLVGALSAALVWLFGLFPGGLLESAPWLVVLLVTSIAQGVVYAGVRHLRFFLRVTRVGRVLAAQQSEEAKASLADRLEELLREHTRRSPRTKVERRNRARCTFMVVAQLNEAGLFSRSLRLLEELPEPETGSTEWQIYRSAQAILHLYGGDRRRGEELLSAIERPGKEPRIEEVLAINEALFAILRGEPSAPREALDRFGEVFDEAAEATLERSRELLRAQALAALGEGERARAILARVRERHNAAALTRVLLAGGPAAPIARDVLAERGDPYR